MASGLRLNAILRQTAEMRRLSDYYRRAAIAASPNVIGFDRFVAFSSRVRVVEIDCAVSR